MDFSSISNRFQWILFKDQKDKNVTYIYVSKCQICRLRGSSDILYIGKTKQTIKNRYKQETNTKNTPKNSQATNIRLHHILPKIKIRNIDWDLYYYKGLNYKLLSNEQTQFLGDLQTWDKSYYLKNGNGKNTPITISLEKYLLVKYVVDHLELPPLNNKF